MEYAEYTNFIKQTAKDYDMDPYDVQKIFNDSLADDFYQSLEEFISERVKQ